MENKSIELIRDMAVAGTALTSASLLSDAEDIQYVLVPQGMEMKTLDQYLPQPRRLKQSNQFTTIKSLVEYIKKWKGENTLIFGALTGQHQITATLDYHEDKDSPSWCGHQAMLAVSRTPEWNTWVKSNKQKFDQRDFIHFLEDNAEDIKKPNLGEIMKSITDVEIKGSSGMKSRVSTTEENKSAESNVKIESGLPAIIELGLRPWSYADHYLVKARPYLHHTDGKVQFSYHLINTERVEEDCFNKCVEQVQEGTCIDVYI